MKTIILICFTSLVLFNCITYSQDTNIVKYFPLKVGNIWVYQCYAYGPYCGCSVKIREKVDSLIIINSKKYFLFHTSSIVYYCGGSGCYCGNSILFDTLRIDSISGNIYKYTYANSCSYSLHEILQDSLKSRLNDKIILNCGTDTSYKCTDTNSQSIFGQLRETKVFSDGYFEQFWGRTYVKGIGLYNYGMGSPGGSGSTTLLGCVINGVLYGDTSFPVGIIKSNSVVPNSFELYQNCPNPFNPTTKIKFSLPLPSKGGVTNVSLKIFDILGNEIASLIPPLREGQEGLAPGTYEVVFDGSNYPSGVYFYQIKTESFSQTKKLILLK